jgi:hypothetical protein
MSNTVNVVKLLVKATTAKESDAYRGPHNEMRVCNVQGIVKGTGSVAASVDILGSNDGETYETLGTLDLSGTDLASDSLKIDAPWAFIKAGIDTDPTGAVTVLMAI